MKSTLRGGVLAGAVLSGCWFWWQSGSDRSEQLSSSANPISVSSDRSSATKGFAKLQVVHSPKTQQLGRIHSALLLDHGKLEAMLQLLAEDEALTLSALSLLEDPVPEGWEQPKLTYDFEVVAEALQQHFGGLPFDDVVKKLQLLDGNTFVLNPTLTRVVEKAASKAENRAQITAWTVGKSDSEPVYATAEAIGTSFVLHDVESLKSLVSAMPEGRAREETLFAAIKTWGDRDLVSASEYLATLSPSASTDLPNMNVSERLAEIDPANAMPWAMAIKDPDFRGMALVNAAGTWHQSEPKGYQQWFQANRSNLSGEDRALLEAHFGK